jgi:Ca2+-binding EF-hand superfamily protein
MDHLVVNNQNNSNSSENVNNQISSEFEKELRDAFNEFDLDKSGTISKMELGKFLRRLGYNPTMVELQDMIDEVDKDKLGSIRFEEFKLIMTKTIRDEYIQNSAIEAFTVFDKHKTGKIKKEHLQEILMTKGDKNLDENEIFELIRNIPFDENDEINFRELVKDTFDLFN